MFKFRSYFPNLIQIGTDSVVDLGSGLVTQFTIIALFPIGDKIITVVKLSVDESRKMVIRFYSVKLNTGSKANSAA